MNEVRIPMAKAKLGGGHVFRLRSVPDIFSKLYREKVRFEKAAKGEGLRDKGDAAINFAITAWHITDWVWERHKAELRKHYGECKLCFQRTIRQECPDLGICDVIANAAKHGGVAHPRRDRPKIETVLIAQDVEIVTDMANREWSLRIETEGKSKDPHEVFYNVFQFWSKFIQKHCVGK